MTNLIKILLLALLLPACTTVSKHPPGTDSNTINKESEGIFIADYGDFGPPQLASKLIGNKWWQWDDPENRKSVTYDVKVVVYRNIDLEKVKNAFPVIPKIKQDYRYVAYEDASKYFAERILEFEKEIQTYDNPSDLGMMCVFPLGLYKTSLAMEKTLRK